MSESNVPNPFDSATRVSGITVRLRPEDLMAAHASPDREDITRLLDRHGGTLAAAMLSAGIEAAVEIIRQEGGAS